LAPGLFLLGCGVWGLGKAGRYTRDWNATEVQLAAALKVNFNISFKISFNIGFNISSR